MPAAVKPRGRGRGRGGGSAGAVVRYDPADRGGDGDTRPQARVRYGANAILHEYPLTPTPLPVRAQRQKRRSEAGYRPRIVELDPDTDRTLQPTPAPPTAGRRSSVQSRLSLASSVPSFSPGGVITSTRLESPGGSRRSSGPFRRPLAPQQRAGGGPAAAAGRQAVQRSVVAAERDAGAAAGSWQTPVTRRSATSSASSAESTPETQVKKIDVKQKRGRGRPRKQDSGSRLGKANASQRKSQNRSANASLAEKNPQVETPASQKRSAATPADRSRSRSAGSSAARSQSRSGGSGGRGRGRGRGRGASARSRSSLRRPGEDSEEGEEPAEDGRRTEEHHSVSEPEPEIELSLDDSNDRTFRPGPEDGWSSPRRGRPSDSTVTRGRPSVMSQSGGRPSVASRLGRGRPSVTSRSGRGRPSMAEQAGKGRPSETETARSERGRPSKAAPADKSRSSRAEEGSRLSAAGFEPNRSVRKSKDVTASQLSRRSDHPALTSRPRGRRSTPGPSLRCPLTVRVAGRTRTVAANSRDDLMETAEDLAEAARARPLQCYADVGRFTWDLDQCVIDLMALKKAGRQGATKMLAAVKKARAAAEAVLQPVKVELVTLYNAAHKEDARRRQEDAVRAFLFEEDPDSGEE